MKQSRLSAPADVPCMLDDFIVSLLVLVPFLAHACHSGTTFEETGPHTSCWITCCSEYVFKSVYMKNPTRCFVSAQLASDWQYIHQPFR